MADETNYVDSPLLGKTKVPTESDIIEIKKIVEDCPLGVFQELNKYFNTKQLCLNISQLKKGS